MESSLFSFLGNFLVQVISEGREEYACLQLNKVSIYLQFLLDYFPEEKFFIRIETCFVVYYLLFRRHLFLSND